MAIATARFTAVVIHGIPTVRDAETCKVVARQGVWTEAFAAVTAADLEEHPGAAHLLTWEEA